MIRNELQYECPFRKSAMPDKPQEKQMDFFPVAKIWCTQNRLKCSKVDDFFSPLV